MAALTWNTIAAVCFDLDGTLVDSEGEAADAIALALQPLGRPLSPAERDFVVGHGFGEIYRFIRDNGGLPWDARQFEAEVYAARVTLFERHGPCELPSARQAVRWVSACKPCALVTGSTRPEAELMLRALSLTDCFTRTVCAGEYQHGKPDPEPYLRAAAALAVDPMHCLAIEDSAAGIAAARAAGMRCIAVRAGNRYGQDQSEADRILDTLSDVLLALPDVAFSGESR
jgi:beta-phosphoglucomutase-like phosphatase (HAD superfamily)